jgi:hypothetical protein
MTSDADDWRAAGELAELAQADLDGLHGCITIRPTTVRVLPLCHRAGTPAAAVLNPNAVTLFSPE